MNYERLNLDRVAYERRTEEAKGRAYWMRRRIAAHDGDSERDQRLAACECRCCFYLTRPRIGGAACCQRPCAVCGSTVHSGNTDVNVLCKPCASQRRLCAHCGGDLDGVVRRKKDLSRIEE